jgi:polar amino acid transport system permease protein
MTKRESNKERRVGGSRWRRSLAAGIREALYVLVAGGCGLGLAVWCIRNVTYNWQWYRVPRYLFSRQSGEWVAGPLLHGLRISLEISAISLVLTLVIGLTTALLRLSASPSGRFVSRLYLESIRNTPLLIQLFCIYFVLAPILGIQAFAAAVLSLSLFEGAYASEIIRGGICGIVRGQWEAAAALGLNTPDTYRFVILPQAMRHVLPPLASLAISLVKDSALVSTIAIADLTMQGRSVVAETYLTFEIWFTVAGIYLLLALALSLGVDWIGRRTAMNEQGA